MWRSSLDGILNGAELKSSALLLPLAPCWAGAHPFFALYSAKAIKFLQVAARNLASPIPKMQEKFLKLAKNFLKSLLTNQLKYGII